MLPFLKAKKQPGTVMVSTISDGESKIDSSGDGLIAAAEEIMSAIAMKDAVALASALKAAFQICDSEPHVEGEHVE